MKGHCLKLFPSVNVIMHVPFIYVVYKILYTMMLDILLYSPRLAKTKILIDLVVFEAPTKFLSLKITLCT